MSIVSLSSSFEMSSHSTSLASSNSSEEAEMAEPCAAVALGPAIIGVRVAGSAGGAMVVAPSAALSSPDTVLSSSVSISSVLSSTDLWGSAMVPRSSCQATIGVPLRFPGSHPFEVS